MNSKSSEDSECDLAMVLCGQERDHTFNGEGEEVEAVDILQVKKWRWMQDACARRQLRHGVLGTDRYQVGVC